jgi:hypothetical protein
MPLPNEIHDADTRADLIDRGKPGSRDRDPAAERREQENPIRADSGNGIAVGQDEATVRAASGRPRRDRTAAQLAAESFPYTAAEGVVAASEPVLSSAVTT